MKIGDEVLSLSVDNMPDESNEALSYRVWDEHVGVFNYADSKSEVREVRSIYWGGGHYVVTMEDGSILNVTRSHEALVWRCGGNVFSWVTAEGWVEGDKLFRTDKEWIAITDVGINTGKHLVHTINVEEEDVYFAGNFLVHNK